PAVDAEVLQYYDALLRALGISRYQLQLNSIGDRTCRPAYVERLNAWLDAHEDLLDDDAKQKRATSPLRVFDVKNEQVRAALQDAPKIGESLCDECKEHFEQVRAHLDAYGVEYTVEPTLVRGLDYYTRTTFEFIGPDESSQASTICGGGRYDYLVEEIGGPPTSAAACRSPVGSTPAAITAGSSSSTCATTPARCSSSSTPSARRRRRRRRTRSATSSCSKRKARSSAAHRRPSTRTSRPARSRCRSTRCAFSRAPIRCRSRSVTTWTRCCACGTAGSTCVAIACSATSA